MKIIHITGHSNSGKTTFIHSLLDRMVPLYPQKVGVIKHMGHHNFELEQGKDTTTHYEHGAYYTAGLDSNKAMVAIHSNQLSKTLDLFSDSGIEYTIIEGFKDEGFKKIIMGDLDIENCIMRNPSVEEVVNSLESFDDYYTMQGIIKKLKYETDMTHAGSILTFNGIVREFSNDSRTTHMDFFDYQKTDEIISSLEDEVKKIPGILNAKFHHNKGRLFAGCDITYFAIISSHRQEAFSAMSNAIDRLKRELHDIGKELSD
ncbi:MAG: molybdopterin-guanine dinucleotide biosynthesis protein B [Methanomicrobium sp.]|nr:molybdopterin-guanine dinucleotide biosynthesis protein B [Methanomicrobium sp.]MDD4299025.1 molybdopterin-guanine dinucleotide biosynthesis protein B [Methanomicrobium sp.]